MVAASEDARHQWLVDKGAFRAIPTEGHESVHSRLHSLGYRKHDAPIVRRTFICTGVKVASGVPSEGCVSCDLKQHDSQWLFFCLGRLCRLIAVGHAVRHSESNNYQRVKQMPLSVAQLPEPLSMVPPATLASATSHNTRRAERN